MRLNIQEELNDLDKLYLVKDIKKLNIDKINQIDGSDYAFYRIDEITYEDKAPRKEALENVISSMMIEGLNFIYLIKGDKSGVKFYYGVSKDLGKEKTNFQIKDVGDNVLKPSLQGNFRGSLITKISPDEKKNIIKDMNNFNNINVLEGVPGINKDDEKFQSVDRIIDVMLGDEFIVMLIAKPVFDKEITSIKNRMFKMYNSIAPISKSSVQKSVGSSEGESKGATTGISKTGGSSKSNSSQESVSKSSSQTKGEVNKNSKNRKETKGSNIDNSYSQTGGESSSTSKSVSTSESVSSSSSKSDTETKQTGKNEGSATTFEIIDKNIQEWTKYMDEIVFPRLDYGIGKGLFVTSTVFFANSPLSVVKLENTWKSVYGSEEGNIMPLKGCNIKSTTINDEGEKTTKNANDNFVNILMNLQIPKCTFAESQSEEDFIMRTACSQFLTNNKTIIFGNCMSSQELSLIAGLPQKEVVGMSLREEVDFGLNYNNDISNDSDNLISIGNLVQSGEVFDGKDGKPDIEVKFNKNDFDKHIFVTGVTGSGKTTTCQKLLSESKRSFLVVEPAKTEYRNMAIHDKEILVFTLGNETVAPFRLNPFEFFEGENITSRVDMIKASMEAAFDMEAAIPQLLETAMYECYEDKGWNISTNKNTKFDKPFDDGCFSFPTLEDLENKIESVVKAQGFDDRLKDEYIGSIKARLKGLTVGSKGQMLNTFRSINFVELLDKKVILELECVKSASEKSLIMGFILSNLSEAIKYKYNQNNQKQIDHITLIEEAHRLLSKYSTGDSMNKKQGVEMFSDMLAEVRKYGESLVIVDQIPNKLTPEVLKNTNTKIVHKIFAQDDKEAIGNTMALKDEQKGFLSYLTCGRAIMMMGGQSKAIQVQIKKYDEKQEDKETDKNEHKFETLNDEHLNKKILKYYSDIFKKGVLPGIERLDKCPSEKVLKNYFELLQRSSLLVKEYPNCIHKHCISKEFKEELKKVTNN
ncbi:MAG: DUF87 domain-containing protein, partial [Lachnospiraceae bacterium]|nr:DUF87 domain-containing protein [Lachnospiraceae bacterium]